MTQELQNKVAIVTGGTSGIGRDTAVLFAKEGARVVVAGRRQAEGQETIDLIRAAGGDSIFVPTDVSKTPDVQALMQKTIKTFGRVDIGFNNAGIEGNWLPIAEQAEEDFDRTIAINLKGVWLCLKYEIQQMLKQGAGGAIVNMSSVAGFIGSAGASTYCATKHGVIGLTKGAALETCDQRHSRQCHLPRRHRDPDGRTPLRRPGSQEVLARTPSHRALRSADGSRGSRPLDVLRPRFLHDRQSLVLDGGFLAGPNAPAQ